MALIQRPNGSIASEKMPADDNDNMPRALRQHLSYLDALPYIDKEYEHPDTQAMVHKMIEEEMKLFVPRDYLADLPAPPALDFPKSAVLKNEFMRMATGKPMEKINPSKYNINPPPKELEQDVQAWKGAVHNSKVQLEYEQIKMLNLEMMENFGAQVWLEHNKQNENINKFLDHQVKAKRAEADLINAKRKNEQDDLLPQLIRTSQKRDELVNGNLQVTRALETARLEAKRLRTEAVAAGVAEEEVRRIAEAAAAEAAAARAAAVGALLGTAAAAAPAAPEGGEAEGEGEEGEGEEGGAVAMEEG